MRLTTIKSNRLKTEKAKGVQVQRLIKQVIYPSVCKILWYTLNSYVKTALFFLSITIKFEHENSGRMGESINLQDHT